MSRRNNGKLPKLELNKPPPPPRGGPSRVAGRNESPHRSSTSSSGTTVSPPSSCVSSETEQKQAGSPGGEATSMVLAGCPRCLMYVMLSEEDPKCPKCNNTVLLDFQHDDNKKTSKR